VIRERKLLVVNGVCMTVDATEVSLALAPDKNRVFAILDVGNFHVCWLISAGSVSLEELPE
jgi:hypothetical protein